MKVFSNGLKSEAPFARLRRVVTAAAFTFGFASATIAQEIPLGVGDQIDVMITGLPELAMSSTVMENDIINLGWLGDFETDGRTVTDLEAEIARQADGFIVKQYDREGGQFLIQLEAHDVNIVRTAYKPVLVAGAVSNPGEVVFTPRMTVRDAVALGGGIDDRLLPDDVQVDALQLARWQSDFGQAAIRYAEAAILSWRIEAELAADPSPELSLDRMSSVSPDAISRIEAAQRRILAQNLETSAASDAYFRQAVLQAEQRLDILRQQQETMTRALEADEQEEARVVDLVERGLAAGSRDVDARRATMQTATRLLDIEDNLARTEIELTRTLWNAEQVKDARIESLLADQVAADVRAREARLNMDVLGQFLALAGSEIATVDVTSEFGVTISLYRRSEGELRRSAADMDTVLMPGDTVEANFEEIIPATLTD